MRVLVTGGAGFIGSAVVRHLAGEGHHVLAFDKRTYAGDLAAPAPLDNRAGRAPWRQRDQGQRLGLENPASSKLGVVS